MQKPDLYYIHVDLFNHYVTLMVLHWNMLHVDICHIGGAALEHAEL